jgi:hypothetical protein
MAVGDQRQAPPFSTPGKRPGTPRTGGWVDHRAVLTGAESLAFTRILYAHRAGRSESPYRLSYAGPFVR